MLKHLTRTHTGAMKAHHASVSDTGGTSTARRSRASRHASNLRAAETTETSESYQTVCGSSQGVQESNGTAHLKLVALLDNRPVMRIFERVRSVFALPTRMTGKSSMSKESTRDAQVAGYHL